MKYFNWDLPNIIYKWGIECINIKLYRINNSNIESNLNVTLYTIFADANLISFISFFVIFS